MGKYLVYNFHHSTVISARYLWPLLCANLYTNAIFIKVSFSSLRYGLVIFHKHNSIIQLTRLQASHTCHMIFLLGLQVWTFCNPQNRTFCQKVLLCLHYDDCTVARLWLVSLKALTEKWRKNTDWAVHGGKLSSGRWGSHKYCVDTYTFAYWTKL